jgi:hypothetical protein
MTHFDPALQLPDDFEAQVQMEVGILKGPHVKWIWNRRFIGDNAFLDIRRTACSVLKGLVTGRFEYLVTDVAPANFETKLRQPVVGHIQNATQQANKLNCKIIGCSEGAELGFQYGTHPLLKNKHDIPAFLEVQKAKFEELKALDVDKEHKMHPVKFIDAIMQLGPFLGGAANGTKPPTARQSRPARQIQQYNLLT